MKKKKKIKEFVVDLEKPYLGFCLGCQLLGEVTEEEKKAVAENTRHYQDNWKKYSKSVF